MSSFEVIALDTTTPQLRAPATGGTYSMPRLLAITPETLTGSATTSGLSVTQTWNTTGTPSAFDISITDTASNAASMLATFRVGGTSKFGIAKSGNLTLVNSAVIAQATSDNLSLTLAADKVTLKYFANPVAILGNSGLQMKSAGVIGFSSSTDASAAADLILARDAANTLAQRNGTNAQAFNVYNTYTDASNCERGFFRFSSNVLQIGAEAAGTGTARSIRIGNPGSVGGASPTITIDPAASATGGTQSVVLSVKGNTGFEFNSFNNTNIGNGSGSTTLRASASGGVVVATTFQQFDEVTAPSSPATNRVRIYAEDNGSGKTRLMALFATGAAVQIAIEP